MLSTITRKRARPKARIVKSPLKTPSPKRDKRTNFPCDSTYLKGQDV
jgi:hypothetical protein